MEQPELENRVKEIFEQQGFEVEKTDNEMEASKNGNRKELQVFASSEFSADEVKEDAEDTALVFVDEKLEKLAQEMDVSVISEERDEEEYELPSYELIGDIAVINELTVEEGEAVEGILEHHPHVETILLKEEPLSGEYRVGEYEKLYGDRTETVHQEFGCRYRVDPTVTYFSERLATERKRVADQVEKNDRVLVIGAGVGPYPVLIARKSEAEEVVAVEKNPEAFEYLEENIVLNGVEDTVDAIEGDARELEIDGSFDRSVIAVPEFSEEFLETAVSYTAVGGIIHYYTFLEDEEQEEELERVGNHVSDFKVRGKTVCGQRGPSVNRVCFDIEMEEK